MKTYNVIFIEGEPDTTVWDTAPKALIEEPSDPRYPSPYTTEAQVVYNDRALFVHLKTNETQLRAMCNHRNDEVCADSCMEFFFAPDADNPCYFNFEINPIGTLLLFVCNRRDFSPTVDDKRIFNIKSIITKDGWELFYEIPFTFITKYFDKISPTMVANFYKCGEEAEPRHFASWSKLAEHDFHRPEDFGMLIFEGK